MTLAAFDEMKQSLRFSSEDAANLRQLRRHVAPHFPSMITAVMNGIGAYVAAGASASGGRMSRDEMHATMLNWLAGMFVDEYEGNYPEQREQVGQAHLSLGLPQHILLTAIGTVGMMLNTLIEDLPVAQQRRFRASAQKLLTLEAGLTVLGYTQSYAEHVRQLEHAAVEARLSEAEKLAQIGRMAASLAHEIKNPLTGISGAIQVIRDGMPLDNPHRDILGEVLRQIVRLDRAVMDLLVYARPKTPRYHACNLDETVGRITALLREEPAFRRVHFEFNTPVGSPIVDADEGQLEQLLMNLILNSSQATPAGGLVRLTAEPAAEGMQITIEDSGCGMDPETAGRACEPFFTTKARGTGLGLAICERIVRSHGGRLDIVSRPGRGTTVTVHLPARPLAAATAEGAT